LTASVGAASAAKGKNAEAPRDVTGESVAARSTLRKHADLQTFSR
jgi:hypothetical protein